jgi:hypothetical protein
MLKRRSKSLTEIITRSVAKKNTEKNNSNSNLQQETVRSVVNKNTERSSSDSKLNKTIKQELESLSSTSWNSNYCGSIHINENLDHLYDSVHSSTEKSENMSLGHNSKDLPPFENEENKNDGNESEDSVESSASKLLAKKKKMKKDAMKDKNSSSGVKSKTKKKSAKKNENKQSDDESDEDVKKAIKKRGKKHDEKRRKDDDDPSSPSSSSSSSSSVSDDDSDQSIISSMSSATCRKLKQKSDVVGTACRNYFIPFNRASVVAFLKSVENAMNSVDIYEESDDLKKKILNVAKTKLLEPMLVSVNYRNFAHFKKNVMKFFRPTVNSEVLKTQISTCMFTINSPFDEHVAKFRKFKEDLNFAVEFECHQRGKKYSEYQIIEMKNNEKFIAAHFLRSFPSQVKEHFSKRTKRFEKAVSIASEAYNIQCEAYKQKNYARLMEKDRLERAAKNSNRAPQSNRNYGRNNYTNRQQASQQQANASTSGAYAGARNNSSGAATGVTNQNSTAANTSTNNGDAQQRRRDPCYNCGTFGHIAKFCDKPRQQPANNYDFNDEEDECDSDNSKNSRSASAHLSALQLKS